MKKKQSKNNTLHLVKVLKYKYKRNAISEKLDDNKSHDVSHSVICTYEYAFVPFLDIHMGTLYLSIRLIAPSAYLSRKYI